MRGGWGERDGAPPPDFYSSSGARAWREGCGGPVGAGTAPDGREVRGCSGRDSRARWTGHKAQLYLTGPGRWRGRLGREEAAGSPATGGPALAGAGDGAAVNITALVAGNRRARPEAQTRKHEHRSLWPVLRDRAERSKPLTAGAHLTQLLTCGLADGAAGRGWQGTGPAGGPARNPPGPRSA